MRTRNEINEDMSQANRAIEVTLNYLYLGDQHKMSSGGENICFCNNPNNIDFSPMWGGVKDNSLPENQAQGEGDIDPMLVTYMPLI